MNINAHDLPDRPLVILDNAVVKFLLLQLGVLDRFQFPAESEAATFFLPIGDHKTHWIIPAIFRGFEEPKENGYMFIAWPKARVSRKQAETLARAALKKHAGIMIPKNRMLFNPTPAPDS